MGCHCGVRARNLKTRALEGTRDIKVIIGMRCKAALRRETPPLRRGAPA